LESAGADGFLQINPYFGIKFLKVAKKQNLKQEYKIKKK
jgi:hypothetical protein